MLTGPQHMRFATLWEDLSVQLAERCANALMCGDLDAARLYARRRWEALARHHCAFHCATSDLFEDFREGPPC